MNGAAMRPVWMYEKVSDSSGERAPPFPQEGEMLMRIRKIRLYRAAWLLVVPLLAAIGLSGCSSGSNDVAAQPPALAVTTPATATVGQTAVITVVGTPHNPAVPLTYAVSGAPKSVTLNAATGACTMTPTYDEIGVQSMKFTVTEGLLSTSKTVQIKVQQNIAVDPTVAVAGGTLDPLAIPKYVMPLVIPPVMKNKGTANEYAIAVRQFKQQILPGGIWNTVTGRLDAFPATTVWSYGPSADPAPNSTGLGGGAGIAPAANSQFNYPAYTVETRADTPVKVRWINDLVDANGNYLPHLLPVDQTIHWANPKQQCADGVARTNCMGMDPTPYTGPVPIITHVHGAHVAPHSDGYPEAWWLPAANNIPAGYARSGSFFDDSTGTNPGNLGFADFAYRNDQPATTIWYHDHALGMTRSNVYAGPAGFWLIRGDHTPAGGAVVRDAVDDFSTAAANDGVLPGRAPVAGDSVLALNVPGDPVRNAIREIPIVIQDRSFNSDGSLFYPSNRAFFEGLNPSQVLVNFAPTSDIPPIWNPEAFFNVIVVNGVSWPKLEVARAKYRFRLLDGCNSRTLNLALFVVNPATGRIDPTREVPFYLIGTEQGSLPKVVKVTTGFATQLPVNGTVPAPVAAPDPDQALLMALAERLDVIVDFAGLADGTIVRMINTAPDFPFGGFDGAVGEPSVADPLTTGQIMQYVVNNTLTGASATDPGGATPATAVENLVLKPETLPGPAIRQRNVSLNELESSEVCVVFGIGGTIVQLASVVPAANEADVPRFLADCAAAGGEPYGPEQARLGTVNLADPANPLGIPLRWTDESGVSTAVNVTKADGVTVRQVNVTENPTVGDTEQWEIYNFTVDAHPIHLHLVRFQVVGRHLFDGTPSPHGSVQPWETGYKDTVIAYPGEVTEIRAKFDIPGLYVWHCHIVEHEDNEMMRPYVVSP
jgi:spore coat protein A, manganese oxidase